MSNKFKDDLNEFFRSKLTNSDPADNKWNVPDDSAFEGAMGFLDDQKHAKKSIGIKTGIILLSLFLIGAFSFGIYNLIDSKNHEILTLKASIEKNRTAESISKNTQEQLSKENENLKLELDNLKLALSNTKEQLINGESRMNKLENNNQNLTQSNNELLNTIASLNAEIEDAPSFVSVKEPKKFIDESGLNKASKSRNIVALSALNFNHNDVLLSLDQRVKDKEINLQIVQQSTVVKPIKKWKLSAYLGANLSSVAMNNMNAMNVDLNGYQNRQLGGNAMLRLGYQLTNKISTSINIGSSTLNNESLLNHSESFQNQNIYTNALGDNIYSMDMTIESPFGVMNRATEFGVLSSELEGNQMSTHTNLTQKLETNSIGLGLNYELFSVRKIKSAIGIGVDFNQICHSSMEGETSIFMDNKDMGYFESTSHHLGKSKNNFISSRLELGVSYEIKDNFELSFLSQYGRSVNSLRDNSLNNSPGTYLNRIKLFFGTNVRF